MKYLGFFTKVVKMEGKVKISNTAISTNMLKHLMKMKEKIMIFVRTLAGRKTIKIIC